MDCARGVLTGDGSRSGRLLSDPDVRRWYTNLCEGSELTADIYLRRLDMICEVFGKSHQDLAKLYGRPEIDPSLLCVLNAIPLYPRIRVEKSNQVRKTGQKRSWTTFAQWNQTRIWRGPWKRLHEALAASMFRALVQVSLRNAFYSDLAGAHCFELQSLPA